MRPTTTPFTALLLATLAVPSFGPTLRAQADPSVIERLRRDQDEILRKTERLQALMQRLLVRYEREGKQEQVALLQKGIEHLSRTNVLRDVASIRDDLESTAFTEALRKQNQVVDELERLLDILLARKSMESLDQQLATIGAQARSARELEQRQRELIQQALRAMQQEATPAERELLDRLARLRDEERREAQRNTQQAGTRRPFLESALQRVRELLSRQDALDQALEDESAGRTPAAKSEQFDLGELAQRARELQASLRDEQRQQSLGERGKALQEAMAGNDREAAQRARDAFEADVQKAPRRPGGPDGSVRDPEWSALAQRARAAAGADTAPGREELQRIGQDAERLAAERAAAAAKANQETAAKVAQDAQKLADRLADGQAPPPESSAAAAAAEAREHLERAANATRQGDASAAQRSVDQAITALDQSRNRHVREHPDAARAAGEMAAEASSTAQELANAPAPEQAEQAASDALREAAEALRKVGDAVDQARERGQRPDAGQPAAAGRQQLDAARQALEQALQNAAEGNAQELGAAADRQRELERATAAAEQAVANAASQGQLTPAQQKAAEQTLGEARKGMQQAAEQLDRGMQASASQSQSAAAEALQRAADAIEKNQKASPEQKDRLREQARQQEQLTEDIIRLARELKERDNKNAERAANEAAEASRRAQRALDDGDAEETQQQQERARQKLEDAAKELEQEEDRYQDLRQEELLFRMKEELTTFLEKQRPLTKSTVELQKAAGNDNLSRPARRQANQLGEEEQVLVGKTKLLVSALSDEGNLVYQAVLQANLEDLEEVVRRLAGRAPDVGTFTTLLQQDVEKRAEQLLEALAREQKRREQQRKEEQQQQQGENKFDPGREKLVSLIAELEMLKELGNDTRRASENLRTLIEVRRDETITEAEVAMIERLAHRHSEITRLFQQIKQGIEQAMQQMQENPEDASPPRRGR
jgi:hypothetical protein